MARFKLKDICEVSWGDTNVTKSSYVDDGYPAYSASGCDGFLPYFDHDGPGIIISAIGAKCGKTWFTRGRWSCIKNTIYIKSISAEADIHYISYAVSDPNIWPKRGAAQPFISQTDAQNVEISLPTLQIQRRIAGILSTYDELIENSQRRIKIMEEMARSLYREWFVHFRYPGHEKDRRVNSSLGEVPEGWEVKIVEDLIKRISAGKKYDQKTVSKTGSIPVFDQGKSGVIGYHDDDPGVNASESDPVIVFANHTCYQRLIHFPFSAIQNVLPFVPNPSIFRNIYWLHWATKDIIVFNDYKGHWPEFIEKPILLPNSEICLKFGEFVKPISLEIMNLEKSNQILAQTRDLLLPRLMAGRYI